MEYDGAAGSDPKWIHDVPYENWSVTFAASAIDISAVVIERPKGTPMYIRWVLQDSKSPLNNAALHSLLPELPPIVATYTSLSTAGSPATFTGLLGIATYARNPEFYLLEPTLLSGKICPGCAVLTRFAVL